MASTERPILFNSAMVQALLNGKTQTRRIMKVQPSSHWAPYAFGEVHRKVNGEPAPNRILGTGFTNRDGDEAYVSPYGKVGDRLWVRETWGTLFPEDVLKREKQYVHYRATDPAFFERIKCKPSIHMPRWASRITLEITEVRVQRIQDISEADAEAEGCSRGFRTVIPVNGKPQGVSKPYSIPLSYRGGFANLWESCYPGSWDRNDWVFAYTFKRISPEAR